MDTERLVFAFGDGRWECGDHTWIMGVINTTPDSFSDGGLYDDAERAVDQGLRLVAEGADCLDVGGESSRPGAEPVSESEELRRTVPVVRELAKRASVPISIDTTKATVAEAALEAGASIINDITAFTGEARMTEVLRTSQCGCVAMHMRGTPKTMQRLTDYDDVVEQVRGYLAERLEALYTAGIDLRRVMLDPGIGFGKTVEQNVSLIAQLARIRSLGHPVLLGPSKKSFIGNLAGVENPAERVPGTIAACTCGVMTGADVVRAHDVNAVKQAMAVADAVAAQSRCK